MLKFALLVGLGGALGSIARWLLGLSLNTLFPAIPMGTLVANLVAGYLIGICLMVFMSYPNIPPEWRLFIVTGCLGGLSTFSSFSGEVSMLFYEGRILWGSLAIASHVIGSIMMTFLGMATFVMFKLLLK